MPDVILFRPRRRSGSMGASLAVIGCLAVVGGTQSAHAAPTFTNICSGLGVSLPVLTGLAHSVDPTISAVLPALNGVVDGVDTGVVTPLSGKQIKLGLLDPNTNTYTNFSPTACNLQVNGFAVDNAGGITVGGGQILGLGGTGSTPASAGAASAIAFGNGASTAAGIPDALALGTGATVSATNSVALGAGSVALRGAVPVYDALGLIGTQSSAGEVSVGATGALRQVTNLAAGSSDTDAVNVGQLRGVSATLGAATAATLGGGSVYNPLLGTVSLPTFNIRGTVYANVGAALDAVDVALGPNTGSGAGGGTAQRGAVLYDRAADGSTQSSVTLASDAGGPVVIHNLAAGVVASDAATVGQVQAVANNSVQYTTVNGAKTNTIALQGGSPGGVTISNLAPGQQGTDAVNLNQLRSFSGNALGQAQAYTDERISNLKALTDREIASARRDAAGGTALALAATGLRFDDRPGKFSVGGATAYYNGQVGVAFGVAGTSETGRVRVNAAISAAPTIDHPDVGGVIGASFAIN